MSFVNTLYKDLDKECIYRFGYGLGHQIFLDAEQRLNRMLADIDDKNNEMIRWHLEKCLLPTIAMYLSIKNFEGTSNLAYDVTFEVCQNVADKNKNRLKILGKMPLGYIVFKMFAKKYILKNYPIICWKTEWIKYNNEEIHFNYYSCLYKETTQKYQCPEMCSIYCANDVTTFSALAPNIIFERTETLANNNDKCDFHFKHNRRPMQKAVNKES